MRSIFTWRKAFFFLIWHPRFSPYFGYLLMAVLKENLHNYLISKYISPTIHACEAFFYFIKWLPRSFIGVRSYQLHSIDYWTTVEYGGIHIWNSPWKWRPNLRWYTCSFFRSTNFRCELQRSVRLVICTNLSPKFNYLFSGVFCVKHEYELCEGAMEGVGVVVLILL